MDGAGYLETQVSELKKCVNVITTIIELQADQILALEQEIVKLRKKLQIHVKKLNYH